MPSAMSLTVAHNITQSSHSLILLVPLVPEGGFENEFKGEVNMSLEPGHLLHHPSSQERKSYSHFPFWFIPEGVLICFLFILQTPPKFSETHLQ